MFKNKLYRNIFLSISLFVFIYTTIGFVVVYNYRYSIFTQEVADVREQQMVQVANSIEMKLMISRNLLSKFCLDRRMSEFAGASQKDYMDILQIANMIKSDVSTYTDLGVDVGVYNYHTDSVITSLNSYGSKSFFESNGYTGEMQGKNKTLIETDGEPYAVFTNRNTAGEKLITIAQKKYAMGGFPLIMFRMFKEDVLLDNRELSEAFSFYIVDKDTILMGEPMENQKRSIFEFLECPETTDLEAVESAGQEFRRLKLGEMNWDLVMAVKLEDKAIVLFRLMFQLFWIYLGMLLLGLFFVALLSKRLYNPFKRIATIFKNEGTDFIDDEAEFIIENTQMLRQSNEELKELIQKAQISREEVFLLDLLKGTLDEKTVEQGVEQFGLRWLQDGYFLCMVSLSNDKKFYSAYTIEEQKKMIGNIRLIVTEHLNNKIPFRIVEYNCNSFVLLIPSNAETEAGNQLIEISNYAEKEFGLRLLLILSETEKDVAAMPSVFGVLLSVWDYGSFKNNSLLVYTKEFFSKEGKHCYYSMQTESELIDAVVNGEEKKMMILVKSVMHQNYQDSYDPNITQMLVSATVVTVNRILTLLDKEIQEVFGEGTILYLELKMCKDPQELCERIIELYRRLIKHMQSREKKPDNALADKLVDYIKNHYAEDISLTQLSQEFNLSGNYISTLFKELLQCNFKEYLNQYRIEAAIEILKKNPDIKIKDLGLCVGYNSTNSFIRIFKKYKGVSPGQFVEANVKL